MNRAKATTPRNAWRLRVVVLGLIAIMLPLIATRREFDILKELVDLLLDLAEDPSAQPIVDVVDLGNRPREPLHPSYREKR